MDKIRRLILYITVLGLIIKAKSAFSAFNIERQYFEKRERIFEKHHMKHRRVCSIESIIDRITDICDGITW